MKKRGFTLVELLAVIAILAILVIMALPAVLRMFNNARRDSFTNEVNTVIRTARQQYLLSEGQDTTWSNAAGATKSLDLTGNSHLQYYVKMNNEGKITKLQVSNGDFQYAKTGIIDVADSSDVESVTSENAIEVGGSSIVFVSRANANSISVGDEIAIGSEHFNVVSSNSTETTLLAKYNLYVGDIYQISSTNIYTYTYAKTLSQTDSGYGLQSSSAVAYKPESSQTVGVVSFSGTNYWDNSTCQYINTTTLECSGTSSLLDEYATGGASYSDSPYTSYGAYPYVYNSSMSNIAPEIAYGTSGTPTGYGVAQNNGYTIAYYINDYANKLKDLDAPSSLIVRLPSFEEIVSLGCSKSTLNCSRIKSWVNNTSFWIGNAYNSSNLLVWQDGFSYYGFGSISGVRPVIVIPTSSIPN